MAGDTRITKDWPYGPRPRGGRISSAELSRRQAALAKAPLFAGLSKRHLRSLAKATAISTYREGAEIVRQGTSGGGFFVILDGTARVARGNRTLARLSDGDFFGEISLLDGDPRTASVFAESEMACLSLAGRDFLRVLDHEPRLGREMLRELARRIRKLEQPPVG
jgi:CRP/FNR family transcriptional regulator, cyclic AMP receptor protein